MRFCDIYVQTWIRLRGQVALGLKVARMSRTRKHKTPVRVFSHSLQVNNIVVC